jgi:hypothetical protein
MSQQRRSPEEWKKVFERIKKLLDQGEIEPNIQAAADYLKIKYSTLKQGLRKAGVRAEDLRTYATTGGMEGAPPRGQVREEKRANTWTIDANHPRITTLEQLLRFCKVDRRVWRVGENHEINKWEVGAKNKDKELVIKPLIQIKAPLVRKKPIPVFPTLQPITFTAKIPKPQKARRKGVRRGLVITDLQVGFRRNVHTMKMDPFHDRRVLDLAVQLLQYQIFDDVTFLGDELDLSEWSSKFVVEPEFMFTSMPAFIELRWWLEQFRGAAPNAAIDMLEGNHNRIRKAIMAHFQAAYDLRPVDELELPASLSVERLLALHGLHIGYHRHYPDGKKWLTPRLVYIHGNLARGGPGDTAKAMVGRYNVFVVFAHIHRRELVSMKNVWQDGMTIHTAFCPGCACRIDGIVPGSNEETQWQQGLGVVEYVPDEPDVDPHFIPVEIHEGRMIYDGQVFEARERDAEIESLLQEKLSILGENSEGGVKD